MLSGWEGVVHLIPSKPPGMKTAALFCLIGVISFSEAQAKECTGSASVTVHRDNGETEYWDTYTNPNIVLLPGDSATVVFNYQQGVYCTDPQFMLWKDGELIHSGPAGPASWDVTAPGFYQTGGSGLPYYGPGAFFISQTASAPLLLNAKAWLEGPFDPDTGLMRDDLRVAGYIPHSYLSALADDALFDVTGPTAIVDWVYVELRLPEMPTTICQIKQGLLLRNGKIIDPSNGGQLSFNAPPGNYYVAVGHRNHLSAMTQLPVALSAQATTVDFRDVGLATYGTEARKIVGNSAFLWPGNAGCTYVPRSPEQNYETITYTSEKLSYTGADNDRDRILLTLFSYTTGTLFGYTRADVNMDGVAKYTGAHNDRDLILQNVGGLVPTAVRLEQLP